MTMLAASNLEQTEHGLLEMSDNFSDYFNSSNISETNSWFDTLLDERNDFCSLSSSECPSVTSEICEFDAHINDRCTMNSCERLTELTPPLNPTQICNRSRKNENNARKLKKKCQSHQRKWSAMSSKEQTVVLEDLMETVSDKLGLREQLNIIKIISPDAQLLPSDTEFFIDFDLLDDRKFELVKLYVEKELLGTDRHTKVKSRKGDFNTTKQTTQKHNRRKMMKEHEKLTKRCNQLRKERKSGLFSREQVIAMASFNHSKEPQSDDDDDDEEIDILS